MKLFVLVFSLFAFILYGTDQVVQTQEKKDSKSSENAKRAKKVKYRIIAQEVTARSAKGEKLGLLLYVGVSPEDINQESLLSVAAQIKRKYNKLNRVVAGIYNRHEAVQYYRADSPEVFESLCGEYVLDRLKNEDYISFVPQCNYDLNKDSRIRIDIGKEQK